MIRVTPDIFIGERELKLDFIRSSGPGGQNVNKEEPAPLRVKPESTVNPRAGRQGTGRVKLQG